MTSLLPIEDFDQISSVWAKCEKWQDTLAFEDPKASLMPERRITSLFRIQKGLLKSSKVWSPGEKS
jgi:hypothetical protein